ncbi:hypothetical protein P3396_23150, partial [Vibrio parahaemolyticus]|nr:hypothetical protein [Vibrio parahaemolyticus]
MDVFMNASFDVILLNCVMVRIRDERVHHYLYLYLYLFNHLNYLYLYLYSEWAGPKPEMGVVQVELGGA